MISLIPSDSSVCENEIHRNLLENLRRAVKKIISGDYGSEHVGHLGISLKLNDDTRGSKWFSWFLWFSESIADLTGSSRDSSDYRDTILVILNDSRELVIQKILRINPWSQGWVI